MLTYIIVNNFKKIYPILSMACLMTALTNRMLPHPVMMGVISTITMCAILFYVIVVYVMNKDDDNYAYLPRM